MKLSKKQKRAIADAVEYWSNMCVDEGEDIEALPVLGCPLCVSAGRDCCACVIPMVLGDDAARCVELFWPDFCSDNRCSTNADVFLGACLLAAMAGVDVD
jgi:hypothetical protein